MDMDSVHVRNTHQYTIEIGYCVKLKKMKYFLRVLSMSFRFKKPKSFKKKFSPRTNGSYFKIYIFYRIELRISSNF